MAPLPGCCFFWGDVVRWCRTRMRSQPPATGCDPFGIGSEVYVDGCFSESVDWSYVGHPGGMKDGSRWLSPMGDTTGKEGPEFRILKGCQICG